MPGALTVSADALTEKFKALLPKITAFNAEVKEVFSMPVHVSPHTPPGAILVINPADGKPTWVGVDFGGKTDT